ncbi:MAG: HAD family hydrolase [Thainema sp.]
MLINLDYDGVIVDSFEILYQQALQAQVLTGSGRPPTRTDIRTLTNMTFEALGERCQIPPDHIPTFVNHVWELQRQATNHPTLFPGIADRLTELASEHVLTIITASSRTAVEQTLQQHHLESTISLILDGTRYGPKRDRIKLAQHTFGHDARETYMVGDAMSDIRHGKGAGVHTIAVTWGFQSRQQLLQACPDIIIDHPQHLQLALFARENQPNQLA